MCREPFYWSYELRSFSCVCSMNFPWKGEVHSLVCCTRTMPSIYTHQDPLHWTLFDDRKMMKEGNSCICNYYRMHNSRVNNHNSFLFYTETSLQFVTFRECPCKMEQPYLNIFPAKFDLKMVNNNSHLSWVVLKWYTELSRNDNTGLELAVSVCYLYIDWRDR